MRLDNCLNFKDFRKLAKKKLPSPVQSGLSNFLSNLRTPLVVISPKSLLRNPNAVSSIEDLCNGSYECVLDDPDSKHKKVKKIIIDFCNYKNKY